MHKPGTPWPVATRVSFIVAFEELRRQHARLSARRFCEAAEVPYPTFARWWAAWRRQGKRGLLHINKPTGRGSGKVLGGVELGGEHLQQDGRPLGEKGRK